jgi:hypothetical protein
MNGWKKSSRWSARKSNGLAGIEMHIHVPKALHGWRELINEIVIIVIGILIALALEQVMESWRWSQENHDAREELTAELNRDLGRVQFASSQDACIERRLIEIERWLNGFRSGQLLAFNGNIDSRPIFLIPNTSIWEVVKSGQSAAHMPLDVKLAYAGLYDSLKTYESNQRSQMDAWSELEELFGARQLDDREILRGLAKVKAIRYSRTTNSRILPLHAAEIQTLGLSSEPFVNPDPARLTKLCAAAL